MKNTNKIILVVVVVAIAVAVYYWYCQNKKTPATAATAALDSASSGINPNAIVTSTGQVLQPLA